MRAYPNAAVVGCDEEEYAWSKWLGATSVLATVLFRSALNSRWILNKGLLSIAHTDEDTVPFFYSS